ncbi:glutathione S-transferase, N-terminal domain protein [Ochrobactrum quorumnocens]|jgi:glutathione S-transferase|uniref:Glutathione S-transferase, N-terminal domain protein n=1 Tax=Ochrobactrum quorumnocens TaxID=271865 RepID=A0A248UJ14_9HYPH|nr:MULTISPECIES: glutathione S-transferase family protein [Brucella]ASV86674.1 glutathione S-transferase, N-terminal domain protein [[Ochrobactrum] quorumnocens]MCV9908385.1 glutathione S-transferase family protein [Brucella sp. HL-2]
MQLYSRPLSPYSAFVRGVLYLKELPFKPINLPYPFPEDFIHVTPLKRVPVLITGSGETLFEAAIIAEYLEDHFPETPVLPGSPRERALIRLLARVTELEVLGPAMKLFILLSKPEKDDATIDRLFTKLRTGLSVVESRLTDQAFALSDAPTLADAWLVPVRFLMEPLKKLSGKSDLLEAYPKFDTYAVKAKQDPVFELIWNEMNDGLKAFMPQLA